MSTRRTTRAVASQPPPSPAGSQPPASPAPSLPARAAPNPLSVPATPPPHVPTLVPTVAQGQATASLTAGVSLPPTTPPSAPSSASTGQVATVATSSPIAPMTTAAAAAAAASLVNAAMVAATSASTVTTTAPASTLPTVPTAPAHVPQPANVPLPSVTTNVPATSSFPQGATQAAGTSAPSTVPPSVTATPQAPTVVPHAQVVPPSVPAALAGLLSGSTGPPGPPGSSSSQADSSSEDGGEDVVRVSNKIDTKNIRMAKFTGAVPKGSFDSGALEYWTDFQLEVEGAQVMSGQVWSNRIKKLVLASFLDGVARRWLSRFRAANPDASYEATGEAMVEAFRPKLDYQDLILRISAESKRHYETFIEYADRLRVMADNLEGGIAVVANQRQVLITFVNHAVPSLAAEYKRLYDVNDCDDPDSMLTTIMAKLVKDVGHNGSASDKKSSTNDNGKRRKDNRGARVKMEPAKANAVVERKRRPPHKGNQGFKSTGNRNGQFACYVCGSPSHDAAYHRQYIDKAANGNDRAVAKVAAGRED